MMEIMIYLQYLDNINNKSNLNIFDDNKNINIIKDKNKIDMNNKNNNKEDIEMEK